MTRGRGTLERVSDIAGRYFAPWVVPASAVTFFVPPLVALPGAVFSVWHNISGPALATFWSRRPVGATDGERKPRVV